jgi:hypothetical protein
MELSIKSMNVKYTIDKLKTEAKIRGLPLQQR